MATYDTSTGLRALEGSNVISDIDAGFLALATDVAAAITAAVAAAVTTGEIKATARSTAPSGYLLCDGAAISRATYAALFTAIGTTYGVGNGSTTFNIPDLRGRVPVGVDGAAARLSGSDALGSSSGEEYHTLTAAEIPAHSHPVPTNHVGSGDGNAISTSNLGSSGFTSNTSNSTGGGGSHYNMPPYQIVNWMIKI